MLDALQVAARLHATQTRKGTEIPYELRDHPSMPPSDWHMAKNLYSRASAIVHEGGATPQLALWIWLGVMQLAELARPAVVGKPDSKTTREHEN
jgi:hypothetical protein